MRKPFQKSIGKIEREDAHGGSGSRQLLLSTADPVSSQFEAMTKGFLESGATFDWHHHDGVDEFFIVLDGTGVIRFRDGDEFQYGPDDLVYIPAKCEHQIENTGNVTNQFYFIRLNS